MGEILLKAAREVPEVFTDMLRDRRLGQKAVATTMSIDFNNNRVTDALVEHGLPGDIFALDYYGHANGTAASFLGRRGHKKARKQFEDDFPGDYVVLGEPEHAKFLAGKLLGRSHIKALAVGPRVLSLGGVNFSKYAYENCVDVMLDFESEEFVEFLDSFVEQNGNLRERGGAGESHHLTDQSEILIDMAREANR